MMLFGGGAAGCNGNTVPAFLQCQDNLDAARASSICQSHRRAKSPESQMWAADGGGRLLSYHRDAELGEARGLSGAGRTIVKPITSTYPPILALMPSDPGGATGLLVCHGGRTVRWRWVYGDIDVR